MNTSYVCPHCKHEVDVGESFSGATLVCGECWQEFDVSTSHAPTGEIHPKITLPEKLPFFKSGRKLILRDKLHELFAAGAFSELEQSAVEEAVALLGLTREDVAAIARDAFAKEFDAIKIRMEHTWHFTDEDEAEIAALKKKFGIKKVTFEGTAEIFRRIYLLEVKGADAAGDSNRADAESRRTRLLFH